MAATADTELAFAASLLVVPGKVYAASVAARGVATVATGCSVIVEDALSYIGDVVNEPSVASSIPNAFYGVADYQPVQIELDNTNGQYSHLIEDDERGSFVRIRRYDPATQTLTDVFSGMIDQPQVGDTVTLTVTPHDLAALTNPFPRNLVTTREFPTATDVGAPIPVFFGVGEDSPCPYVGHDDVNQTFDYLVGEDLLEIREVQKNGRPTFVHPIAINAASGLGPYDSDTLAPTLTLTPDDSHAPGTYTGFFFRGTVPPITNRYYQVLVHDPPGENQNPQVTGSLEYDPERPASLAACTWWGMFQGIPGVIPFIYDAGFKNYTGATIANTNMTVSINLTANDEFLLVAGAGLVMAAPFTGPTLTIQPNGIRFEQVTALRNLGSSSFQNCALSIWKGRAQTTATVLVTVGVRTTVPFGRIQAFRMTSVTGVITAQDGRHFDYRGGDIRPKTMELNGFPLTSQNSLVFLASCFAITPTVSAGVSSSILHGELASFANLIKVDSGTGTQFTGRMSMAGSLVVNRSAGTLVLDGPLSDAEAAQLPLATPIGQIQEWVPLLPIDQPPVYPNRTAVRFPRRQADQDGQLKQISATAARGKAGINLIAGSEDLTNEAAWSTLGAATIQDLFLDGHPPYPIADPRAQYTYSGPGGLVDAHTLLLGPDPYLSSDDVGLGWFRQQVGIVPPDPTQTTYTLSFWYYDSPFATDFTARIDSFDPTGADLVSQTGGFTITGTGTWIQGQVVLTTPTPVGSLDVVFGNSGPYQGFGIQLSFVQLEPGGAYTYYEKTLADSHSSKLNGAWTMVDVIRDLITNGRWGLGQPVNADNFDTAMRALQGPPGSTASVRLWPVEANGVVPGPFADQPTLKDLLDECARTRGIILTRAHAAWDIAIDAVATPAGPLVLGTEETPFDNVLSTQLAQRPAMADSMGVLRMLYDPQLGLFSNSVEAFWAGGLDRTVSTIGAVQEAQFRFIQTADTADRVSAFLAAYAPYVDRAVTLGLGADANGIEPGQVVTLYAPRLQPQNLIASSERETAPDGWYQAGEGTGLAPSVTRLQGLAPFAQSYAAAKIAFGTGGTGRSITFSGKHSTAIRSVWLKSLEATTPTQCELLLRDAQSNGSNANYSLLIELSKTWTRHTFQQAVRPVDVVEGMYFGIANPASAAAKNVLMWGAQLCFDWPRGYVKTTGSEVDPSYIYKVTQTTVSRTDIQAVAIPYPADVIFAPYTPSTTFLPRVPDDATISVFAVLPDPVTALTVPPNSGTRRHATAGGGTSDFLDAEIQFLMPEQNAAGVIVQIQQEDALGWTDVATVVNPL